MRIISLILLLLIPFYSYSNGKLLATPGVSQIEGSAGGGLVPWAQLAGYATEDEMAISGYCTRTNIDDFSLKSCGVQTNFYDRIELSYAKQEFDVVPLSTTLEQSIYGLKTKLYGDLVYSQWPQISLGVQHKKLKTPNIAYALGAKNDSGTDIYLAASKLHLGAIAGYNLLWNTTLRYTKANEVGLLGFGSSSESYSVNAEASLAILLNEHLAVGVEYRQKPDNLKLNESDWKDLFIAWFPNKNISLTAAYVELGTIAGLPNQNGWYLSMTGYY